MIAKIGVGLSMVLLTGLAGCAPGYMQASDLEAKHQGPSFCAARCEELGMRMAALVLVSDSLPGCVCQPVYPQKGAPAKGAPPATKPAPSEDEDAAAEGASAATTGYVVLAAAAAAARQQQQQQQQRTQQSYSQK